MESALAVRFLPGAVPPLLFRRHPVFAALARVSIAFVPSSCVTAFSLRRSVTVTCPPEVRIIGSSISRDRGFRGGMSALFCHGGGLNYYHKKIVCPRERYRCILYVKEFVNGGKRHRRTHTQGDNWCIVCHGLTADMVMR